jgi:lysophospholipase L1-like esterase
MVRFGAARIHPTRSLLAVAAAVTFALGPAVPASAATSGADRGQDRGHGAYLALGDSVPFGFDPTVPIPSDPHRYVGYPELVGKRVDDLRTTNLSCPGQTSDGLNTTSGTDNGCFAFRAAARLHTPYSGSQLEAASAFLAAHPRTRLVTVTIGANDLFLCAASTADACASPGEIGPTLASVGSHLALTLGTLRAQYRGPLVVVTYYTTNFSNPNSVTAIQALNSVVARTGQAFGATAADGFTPFAQAAAPFGGDACAAGLLIHVSPTTCDIHPSRAGARLLADAVVAAFADDGDH